MKTVYYLSYSDNPSIEGLLFPNELLENTYALGFWMIDLNKNERMPDSFEFNAVDNNQLQILEMKRVDHHVFKVETTKYGKFYFRVNRISSSYNKYVGNSNLINKDSRLYQVISMDTPKLHNTCLHKGFYFVGRIDGNLETSNGQNINPQSL